MNVRSVFAVVAISAALAGIGCSRASTDAVDLTAPLLGAGSVANAMTGTVSALSGACPTLTFAFERRTIKTDASTEFGDGGCTAIKNGLRVEVAGTVQSDGSTKATRISPIPTTPTPTPPLPVPASPAVQTVTGGVKSLSGACPALSFALESKTIKTNAATAFGDGGCAALKNDLRVEVSGTTQTDGSILAVKVSPVPVPPVTPPLPVPPPVTPPTITAIAGAITALSGTCPSLTITVGERKATTSAVTVFDGKTCAALTVGAYVEIAGAPTVITAPLAATKVTARK